MNEYGFCYASFNTQLGDIIVKRKNLQMIKYLKKESDSPVENELPLSFAITQFHIVFMYPKNITVLSKISNEIVYSKNFDTLNLSGIQVDYLHNRILLYSNKEPVYIAYLKGED
jgi:ABC-type transport system involved in Fe-S cluster assembly fused permease/ATPase subunit